MQLEPGNFAIISSDGILSEQCDIWIKTLIADYTGSDAKELAREVLMAAIAKFGCEDDMTVLTVRLEERK